MIPVLTGEQSTGLVSEPTRLSIGNGRWPILCLRLMLDTSSPRACMVINNFAVHAVVCSQRPGSRGIKPSSHHTAFIVVHEQISDIFKRTIHFCVALGSSRAVPVLFRRRNIRPAAPTMHRCQSIPTPAPLAGTPSCSSVRVIQLKLSEPLHKLLQI